MDYNSIEHKFNELPDILKKEVLDFIDFLLTKTKRNPKPDKFDFAWEGGLSDFKDKYDSVDLQHESTEWR